MCCSVAKNVETLYALRFFIGMAEVCSHSYVHSLCSYSSSTQATSYPGMIWVLGSWYGPSELGKRAVICEYSKYHSQFVLADSSPALL